VPFIAYWPGHTPAGTVDDSTVLSGVDLLPSFCSLAGIPVSPELKLDGLDMSQALLGTPMQRAKPLMWEYRYGPWGRHLQKSPALAIRDHDWKLLMNPDGSRIELYNLKANPCEVDNLASENPNRVRRISRQLLDWHKALPGTDSLPARVGSFDYPWPGKM
jgi:arylsulfatase A-like enzyme